MAHILQKLNAIWRQHSLWILLGALLAVGVLVIYSQSARNKRLKEQVAIAHNNLEVYQDSIRIVHNRWLEAEFQKRSYVVQEPQDLKALTLPLYEAIQRLEGQIKSIQKTDVVVNPPDVNIPIIPIGPNKYNFGFDTTYSPGNFESFQGQFDTESLTASQTGRKVGISLITGIRELKKGQPEIFVKSNFPGLTITDIQGAQIDKNYFSKPEAKQPLIKTATLNFGQHLASYNYRDKEFHFLKPEIVMDAGITVDLKQLLKKR